MKEQIIKFLDEGKSYNYIVDAVGCSKATISYHAKKIGKQKEEKKSYDWGAIQNYYNEGFSYRKCKVKFGFCSSAWNNAVKSGKLVVNNIPKKIHELKRRSTARSYVIRNKIIAYQCQICNLEPEWNNKVLVLQIDHINGINNDHRIENLRFLCPNCHSQTETFGNKKRNKHSEVD